MCRFFSAEAAGQCNHDLADPPSEIANANFCEYFSPSHRQGNNSRRQHQLASQSLDELFGDAAQSPLESKPVEDIDSRLSNLFDDD